MRQLRVLGVCSVCTPCVLRVYSVCTPCVLQALELMRNRAHATAARLGLAQRRNAATIAGDATELLERWLPPHTSPL